MYVEGQGRISRSGLTQDIKMGSCVFQCDVPHQWIAQRQVGPVSVYCDGVGCRVLCLRHGIPVWQHIGQSTTAISRHRDDMINILSNWLSLDSIWQKATWYFNKNRFISLYVIHIFESMGRVFFNVFISFFLFKILLFICLFIDGWNNKDEKIVMLRDAASLLGFVCSADALLIYR